MSVRAIPHALAPSTRTQAFLQPIGKGRAGSQDGAIRAGFALRPTQEFPMLHYAVVFFVIALIAAVFGFGGIAAGAAGIAKILFVVFIILAIASFLFGRNRGR